jgi:GNAT superfamily N-acetyltransferase
LEGLEIRIARDEELPEIIALYNLMWVNSESPVTMKVGETLYQRIKENPDDDMYVALLDDRVVGSFTVLVRKTDAGDNECVVENVAVNPKYQRRGIGKSIVRFLADWCKLCGITRLTIASSDKRENVVAFYNALGFERRGSGFIKTID